MSAAGYDQQEKVQLNAACHQHIVVEIMNKQRQWVKYDVMAAQRSGSL